MNFENNFHDGIETKKSVQCQRYESDLGNGVEVTWEEFPAAEQDEKMKTKGVIFLPGFGLESGFQSVRAIGEGLRDFSRVATYTVNTRLETAKSSDDSIMEQAQAIKKFIKDQGITELTIFGYSQGGDKAIDLVSLLQNDSELQLNGIVLIDSTGLYQQDKNGLAKKFIKDAAVDTPLSMIKQLWQANYSKKQRMSMLKKGVMAGLDVVTGVVKDALYFKQDYPQKLDKEVADMADLNLHLADVKIPVIIISGDKDPISDPAKIVPPAEEDRIVREIEQDLDNSKFVDPREKYLQETLLPNSPYVRMIIGKKMGHHSLPYFRPESVARVGLYALERYHRRQNNLDK